MNPEGKIKLLFFGLLFCWTNVVAGQIETRKDTILCNGRIVTFQYPTISKENNFNYEEGFFRTISCIFDSVTITIHCGSMVNLPLTNLTDKNIQYKELYPAKGFNTTRGYDEQNRWFREDTYSDIGLTIAYENAIESKKDFYEWILNYVTTESQLPTQDYTSQKKAPTHDIGLPLIGIYRGYTITSDKEFNKRLSTSNIHILFEKENSAVLYVYSGADTLRQSFKYRIKTLKNKKDANGQLRYLIVRKCKKMYNQPLALRNGDVFVINDNNDLYLNNKWDSIAYVFRKKYSQY